MKNYNIEPGKFTTILKQERKDLDLTLLEKALAFAEIAHAGQKRHSGEDYILHPVAVSFILSRMQADLPTLVAALLHDVLEDTDYSIKDLEDRFGTEVTELVDGVTKLHKYAFHTNHHRTDDQAENYRKLLLSITKDVRVILIKLADRLHNMLTLQYMDAVSQRRIAGETLDIYAPLANRFGLVKLQNELEDLSLKYLNPEEFKGIAGFLNETRNEREEYILKLIPILSFNLLKHEITADISGRSKHIYSIYRKRLVRKVPYAEIYDYAAIRILVENVEQCYSVLGIIHSLFEPIERRFRDYIVRPKSNGYQSLHTVVIGPDDRKVEIQIRTFEMHLIAEEGIAAHWRYKQDSQKKLSDITDDAYEDQLRWIRRILQQGNGDNFVNLLKENLQPQFIVVVTPNNDYIKLPRDASPLDFAFAVHTEIGFRCTGAKVNGRMVPVRTTLHNGDIVEVITSSEPNPSRDWLGFLKTSRARQKVRSWLQWKERQDAIRLGKEIFEKRCRKLHWKCKKEEDIRELARLVHINDANTLYYELGTGKLLFLTIKQAVNERDNPTPADIPMEDLDLRKSHSFGICLADVHSLMINYAACCSPLPGDEVIGYITRGRGISVHRADCPNPSFKHQCEIEPERVMAVQWDLPKSNRENVHLHPVSLSITGKNRARFSFDILGIFARFHAQPAESSTKVEGNTAYAHFRLWLQHAGDLDKICHKILSLPGIDKVERK